jgi:lipoprotein signal peptidase
MRLSLSRPKQVFLLAAGVLICDQLLKRQALISNHASTNVGALFGLTLPAYLPFLLLAAFLFVVYRLIRNSARQALLLPVLLILAGATSNLLDRFLYGYIIDYLQLGHLFLFNLADLALASGALLFVWRITWK